MIIATVTALMYLWGGGGMELFSLEHLKPQIEQYVNSGERQDQLLALIKVEDKKMVEFNKEANAAGKKLLELNKDYDANADEFQGIIDDFEPQLLQAQSRYVELRFALKEKMTREEWQAVFAQP